MKTKTNLSKLLNLLVLLMSCSLSTYADGIREDDWNDNFMILMLHHYESDYVIEEQLNYYRNFLNLSNQDENFALTVENVANGENSFTIYRYDVEQPEILTAVAVLNLAIHNNVANYSIEYQNDTQAYLATDNTNVVTQGVLGVNNGVIDMDDILFVDRFAADVSQNMHPYRYGYVVKSFDNEKSTNVVEVPVMKVGATLDGFYTQEEVIGDVEANLMSNVKNANVEMYLQDNPIIYYYTLERGDNTTTPNTTISHMQRCTDGNFIELCDALSQYGSIYESGLIGRYDNNIVIGQYGDYMSYVPIVWTFGMDRVDYNNNSYGGPILKTGVADLNSSVTGAVNISECWFDEDGEKCTIFNPTLTIESTMPEYASIEYEPYMYRVWRKCNNIRNYKEDASGHLINDVETPRESFMLIAEEYDNSTSIQIGSDDGKELAFGATLNSSNGDISFLVRHYYKKVTQDAEPIIYYVVENDINWDNIVIVYKVGDVNGDGNTDIQDVTLLIDFLLYENGQYYTVEADVNGNGTIDIGDVTALIDILLSGN